jgi:hypothetical protein
MGRRLVSTRPTNKTIVASSGEDFRGEKGSFLRKLAGRFFRFDTHVLIAGRTS